MKKLIVLFAMITSLVTHVKAQENTDTSKKSKWSSHFQLTVIAQKHAGFHAAYSGDKSLADTVEPIATSLTTTLFLGRKLWKGAALYFNPEISGGNGLSFAQGVAGALNGETYRVGAVKPQVFIARAYLQQRFPLADAKYVDVADDVNQVADKIPDSRITITAGKYAISDFYDDNAYSKDPRSQFSNWAIWANGAWDYPANTRGYTMGVVVELIKPRWAVRLSTVAVPRIANASKMEYDMSRAHSETFEYERKWTVRKHPGSARLILSNTHSKAPSYQSGLKAVANSDAFLLSVISGDSENTSYGGKKFGWGASADQEITKDLGIFSRIGWNDGKYATWAFTEIDRTFCLGLSLKGNRWKRPEDVFGLAAVVSGISDEHRAFLKAGGYGFIIGDGNLNYGKEAIVETFYNARLSKQFWLSVNYQFVNNPGYNKDRGPVHVFGVRAHIEF
ncbi:MAG: carbohydrate porin [Sediminibacterium magnilacihabitans]|jgi:high affinity Mn2+ porin|nr:carbohydrate porin [Sediminibacterium magnilacihabitans]PQV61203.1 carbohydrate-selective porin (OprB family) [Sediminibacterium magnilacihabitans]